ncbi:insulin-degrading enzyme-like [Octopus vulgaris]|nr:insulin-degrading enzyme-like [Octopus vulgaris]CAI9736365.1 insulin-degrading enzyme-like [Octopus vulgaris]
MVSSTIEKTYEDDKFIKSEGDKRKYRGLEVSNGMKILLISDPETDKSAAAIDVHIGDMCDPKDLPGLAHFCEHMLFLGTTKYPQENEYSKFVTNHGGTYNASTSPEHTNFHFEVNPPGLQGALDRFAQFFISPLFTPSATEREVNAVNSEHNKNIQDDNWRLQQLERTVSDPSHDYCRFGTGNKDTLETKAKDRGVDTRDELLRFHEKYYSSNIMTLAVLGKESLDELTAMVLPLFDKVVNKNVEIPVWNEHPCGCEQVKTRVITVPVKDLRNLAIVWPIPDIQAYYKSNPGFYLAHLLGHEGRNSLHAELKAKGWVNTLYVYIKSRVHGFMFFTLAVDLTEDGMDHVNDIVTLTFQYLNMLRKEGPQEWIFKEFQSLSNMTFRFKDKENPRNYVVHLTDNLQTFEMTDVLCGEDIWREYRPDLINEILALLIPETVRIFVIAKSFDGKTDQKEHYYGTDYKVEKIEESVLETWRNCETHENLQLPIPNEFIPTNFEIFKREKDSSPLPEIIKDSTMSRLWFKQDDKFLLPKAYLSFEFRSLLANVDPVHTNMTVLFLSAFRDALNEYTYHAEIAGLFYSLDITSYGLGLYVQGYNDKQSVLLKKIMEKFLNFTVDPKRFAILKESYSRTLSNFAAEQPHQHTMYYLTILMTEQMWTKTQLLEAVEDITCDDLQAFIPLLLSKMYIEGLVYGNTSQEKALDLLNMIEDMLLEKSVKPLPHSQQRFYREHQLLDGDHYLYKVTQDVWSSSAVGIYLQTGVQSTQSNMILELFCQVIKEFCFTVLRTQEQLGYLVHSGIRRSRGVQGMLLMVQTDHSADHAEGRMEAFLHSVKNYLDNLTEDDVSVNIQGWAGKRLEAPKELLTQNYKYWVEITSQQYNFDRDNIEVEYLKTLTKSDLINFYNTTVAYDAISRHKLTVHVVPSSVVQKVNETCTKTQEGLSPIPPFQKPIEISDIVAFKRSLALYPLPKPFIDVTKTAKSKL